MLSRASLEVDGDWDLLGWGHLSKDFQGEGTSHEVVRWRAFQKGHPGPRPGSTPALLGEQSGRPGSDTLRDGERCRVSGDMAQRVLMTVGMILAFTQKDGEPRQALSREVMGSDGSRGPS